MNIGRTMSEDQVVNELGEIQTYSTDKLMQTIQRTDATRPSSSEKPDALLLPRIEDPFRHVVYTTDQLVST